MASDATVSDQIPWSHVFRDCYIQRWSTAFLYDRYTVNQRNQHWFFCLSHMETRIVLWYTASNRLFDVPFQFTEELYKNLVTIDIHNGKNDTVICPFE